MSLFHIGGELSSSLKPKRSWLHMVCAQIPLVDLVHDFSMVPWFETIKRPIYTKRQPQHRVHAGIQLSVESLQNGLQPHSRTTLFVFISLFSMRTELLCWLCINNDAWCKLGLTWYQSNMSWVNHNSGITQGGCCLDCSHLCNVLACSQVMHFLN